MIKCVLGMVHPDEGEIFLNNERITGGWQYRENINYLPQIAQFPENLKIRELFSMIKDIRQRPSNEDEFIELFGLETFLDKRIKHLSGGTKQKVNITLSMMFDSPVIIMDEPTAGLDPVAIINLKAILRKRKSEGKMILFTTHIMSLVEELAQEIIFILEGNIYFQGTLNDLITKSGESDFEHAIAEVLRNKSLVIKPSAS